MKLSLKKNLLFIFFFTTFSLVQAQVSATEIKTLNTTTAGTIPFITTWQTTVANETITIPTTGGGYSYTVNWGDLVFSLNQNGDATHTYTAPGIYTVRITGDFPRIFFDDAGDKEKILTIEQWGDNIWTSMSQAFEGCTNLQGNFTDVPDLSLVDNMSAMFSGCVNYNTAMNNWDVSNVTNMSSLFANATIFNSDISNWDVSNVISMSFMFNDARAFNQDISNWQTGNVTTMQRMFFNNEVFPGVFNNDIGAWNVSNVTDMSGMFQGQELFNQDIGNWDVSNVTTMEEMFSSATIFNQDIGAWDVTNVTTMEEMFRLAVSFDQDIGAWNVINVTNAIDMFTGATLSIANYDSLLIGWNGLNLQPNVTFSGGNSRFCLGESARTNMITTDFWDITDAGFVGLVVDDLANQTVVDLFVLPAITGLSLTGNEAYYTGPNGTGTRFLAGDVITFDPTETYPITLYIYDVTEGCESQEDFELTITIDFLPNFFTPNGDAINDLWEISSIEDINAQVFIFDRYGKLLIQLNPLNNLGWDGTYQGIRMPSTDYWYRVVLSDGEILRGNFTLKR